MLIITPMKTFVLTLIISFGLLLAAIFILSYCKRRQSRTNHGLTGMCHQTGGAMCSSCSDKLQSPGRKNLHGKSKSQPLE
jgi:hypothetical protein